MSSGASLAQLATYAAFGALLVALSRHPVYHPVPAGDALLQVSIAHAGVRLRPCRRLSAQELAAQAPNMRAAFKCPRGRSPVRVSIALDGHALLDETVAPSGFARDGLSTLYRRIPVAAGTHLLRVQVDDDVHAPHAGALREVDVRLHAGQVLSIDYGPQRAGIAIS